MSVVGKEAPSTCESLSTNQKVKDWIQSVPMSDIDEECESVISATNEDMLNYVHGYTKKAAQIFDSGVDDSEIDSGLSLSKQNPSTDDSYPFLATGGNHNGRQPLLRFTDTGSTNSGSYVDHCASTNLTNSLPLHTTNESTLTTAMSGIYVDHNNTTSDSRLLSQSNITTDAEDGSYVDRYVTPNHDVKPSPLHSTNESTLPTVVDGNYVDHNNMSNFAEPLSHCNSTTAAEEGSYIDHYVASNTTTAVDGSYIDHDATPNSQPLLHSNISTTAEKGSYIDRFVSSNNDNNPIPLNSTDESSLTTADEGSYIDHYIASNNDPLHSTNSSATTSALNGSYIDHDTASNSKLSHSNNIPVHAPLIKNMNDYATESDV